MSETVFSTEDKTLISTVLRPLSVAYANATKGHFPDVVADATLAIKDFIAASDKDGAMRYLQDMLEPTPFSQLSEVTAEAVMGQCTNG